MGEQPQLFIYFLPDVHKSFAVRFADIGKYANGRLNDLLQLFHFAALRNAGFKYGQLMLIRSFRHTLNGTPICEL